MPIWPSRLFSSSVTFGFFCSPNEEQLGNWLAHRVLLTAAPESYREAAAVHEFAIIDVDELDNPEELAERISAAWTELGLGSRGSYLLRLGGERPIIESIE